MATKTKGVYVKVTPEEKEIIDKLGGATKIIMDAVYKHIRADRQKNKVLKIAEKILRED